MKGAALAVLGSLGVHAGFALVWAWGVAAFGTRIEDETVRLELSKMELGVKERTPERTPSDAVAEQPPDIPAAARMPESTADEQVEAARTETEAAPPSPVAELGMVTAPDEEPAKLEPARRAIPMTAVATKGTPAESPDEANVDEPVKLTKEIKLKYPAAARRRGVTGTVVLHVRVGADGAVTEVTVASSSGNALLDEAAKKSVRGARFVPARRGGHAVAAAVDLPVVFRLNE